MTQAAGGDLYVVVGHFARWDSFFMGQESMFGVDRLQRARAYENYQRGRPQRSKPLGRQGGFKAAPPVTEGSSTLPSALARRDETPGGLQPPAVGGGLATAPVRYMPQIKTAPDALNVRA